MLHPVDEFLGIVGCFLSGFGILAGILCSQDWVLWVAGVGLGMLLAAQMLDKWREQKREKKNFYYW